jgi:5-methylcytosine-specific restriction endonuclease McrA
MAKTYELDEPCVVCGLSGEGMVTAHHIYTRKAYSMFAEYTWNKIPVCQKHHNEFHNYGNQDMARRYNTVKTWLDSHGWQILNGKLIHED